MKKGFTLVELLAVLAITALITTISLVYIINTGESSKDKSQEEYKTIIKSAAYLYIKSDSIIDEKVKNASSNVPYIIPLSELIKNEYIDETNLLNLKEDKNIDINESCVSVYYQISANDYKYVYDVLLNEQNKCKNN